MSTARDRLLKGKSAPKKTIPDEEAIDAGRMLLNDQANNPEFAAPKSNFELSGNPETEDVADEDVENLMNMSPMAQRIFKSKLGKKEDNKVKSISMEDMFSKVSEPSEEEEYSKPTPTPKQEISKEEPKQEEIEEPVNKIPFPSMSGFGKKKEIVEEIEKEIEPDPEPIKKPVKEEVQEKKYEYNEPKKEQKYNDGGRNNMENMSAMEKMMDRMMRNYAKKLVNEARRQGVELGELDSEEMEAVYEYILDKISK